MKELEIRYLDLPELMEFMKDKVNKDEKEQEALQELKDNGFTVIKDYSSRWGDECVQKEILTMKHS